MSTNPEHPDASRLEAGLDQVRQAPANPGVVTCIIRRPGVDQRELLETGELTPEAGLVGDRWAQSCTRRLPSGGLNPDSQIAIMGIRMLELLTPDRDRWPLAGDNLLVDMDLSEANLPAGQRLRVGEVELEITAQPHLGCAKFSCRFGEAAFQFVNSPEGRRLRLRGVYAQVVKAGRVRTGDTLQKI